jgi:hypothetical protein
MPPEKQVTVNTPPAIRRPTPAERRAEQAAILAAQQVRLKQEAADRRRARDAEPAGATPSEHPADR